MANNNICSAIIENGLNCRKSCFLRTTCCNMCHDHCKIYCGNYEPIEYIGENVDNDHYQGNVTNSHENDDNDYDDSDSFINNEKQDLELEDDEEEEDEEDLDESSEKIEQLISTRVLRKRKNNIPNDNTTSKKNKD